MIPSFIPRRIFGSKWEEVVGGWRRLHNEELCNLNASPNIIRLIMLRRMKCMELVACMKEMRNTYRILVGSSEGKRPLEDLGVDGKIISEWILGK
jgi:hypothetical protein